MLYYRSLIYIKVSVFLALCKKREKSFTLYTDERLFTQNKKGCKQKALIQAIQQWNKQN